MDYYKPQIELIKSVKKARNKGQVIKGLYTYDTEGFLLFTPDGYVAYRIPPEDIVISPQKIFSTESVSFINIFTPDGLENVEFGDLKETRVKNKKILTRVFLDNGEEILVNEKYVKEFDASYFCRVPGRYSNPIFFYDYNGNMLGLAMPVKGV